MMSSNAELVKKALKDRKFEEAAEIYFSSSSKTSIKAHEGEIASFSYAETSGLGARVVLGNKMGLSFTEKVNGENIAVSLDKARENATYIPDDKGYAIFESDEERVYDRFKSADLHKVSVEQKKELALEIEKYAKAYDERIINVPEAIYSDVANERIVANSYGLCKTEKASLCYAYAYLMASDGKDTSVGFYFQGEKNFADLDPKKIAELAAEDALCKLNAEEIDSGSYPVIFSASTASSLLGAFINSAGSAFFGENIQKGRSKLEGKLGQLIAASHINIIDDPSIFSMGAASFDDEGVEASTQYLIRNGVFETELHNLYSAKRSGVESTGNGSRGYSSPLSTKLYSPYLQPSDKKEESLFGEAEGGIYITDVEGLHAGLNQISGDFSLAAKGFLIENGKKGKAIKNITVAGNFYDLIKNIIAVADNNRFNDYAEFSSPSIYVKALSVSGK
ncbi:TldD/PmbA family protein [Spirochaeta isovalerica]|uniref:PmbA protein n=1 Tax=Spirochaeta isovalerica TaxID=150 RepID=A0A841RHX1_9SPIO|nr:TldD/PmbA family protein [Spirochaeta isovalerica]MBB6481902.1 PmbA protein [Spirochaeta isovalerica]